MDMREWAQKVWECAESHGFHNEGVNNSPPSWCANLHGEVSEFWEAYRKNKLDQPCDKDVDLTCAEEELADIIIRTLDVAMQMNINIEHAVRVKHEYNMQRSYLHGGKKA